MSTMKNMNLYDIHCEVEDLRVLFTDASNALEVLYEQMERDGFQRKEKFEDGRAINFAHRFPMYLANYRLIQRDLENTLKLMETCAEQILYAYMAQKETTATVAVSKQLHPKAKVRNEEESQA